MDLRAEELITLKAIYEDTLTVSDERVLLNGEISVLSDSKLATSVPFSYSGVVHVPIPLDPPITVSKLGLSHELNHFPPLELAFSLPDLYPYEECPEVHVHSSILPIEVRQEIEQELRQLWYDTKYQVLFAMVDHLHGLVEQPMELMKRACVYSGSNPAVPTGGTKLEAIPGDSEGTKASPDGNIHFTQGPTKITPPSFFPEGNSHLMDLLINTDKTQRQIIFNSSTFECGICQENVFGSQSFQFPQCNHVFCNQCLCDFFMNLIEDANVEKVHCPDFQCSKKIASERETHINQRICSDFDFEEFKKKLMTPPILLEDLQRILESKGGNMIGIDGKIGKSSEKDRKSSGKDGKLTGKEGITSKVSKNVENVENVEKSPRDIYEKYLALFLDHQHNLMAKLFPARLVTCAGEICTNMIFRADVTDLLVVCRKCGYAFCNNCRKSNHSKTRECTGVRQKRQYFGISEDDMEVWAAPKTPENMAQKELLRKTYGSDLLRKLALEYDMDKMDRLFSQLITDGDFSRCPTCDLVIQRSDGCNKMKCSSCYSFFCNVCGAFLPPDTPYEHFNDRTSSCYGKLFEGMPGIEEET